ncbi:MAG TPA: SDR family oxidoreductase [Acidimicrobiales bacterium]|nr:SDR family oxidoreductase [Acidimicrobiales bacterium]
MDDPPETNPVDSLRVLVTGASGYVGSRLVPPLLARDAEVRCLARSPEKLTAAAWRPSVEIARGDVGGDLAEAMAGVDVAVYLVHSIGQGEGWTLREQDDAGNFARAAAAAGVRRIVYLGGLGRDTDLLSHHLQSRHDVGHVLASTGVEVVELRAGVIIGSGSASFEMLRYLVEVLPVMVTPRWVETRCQPIAITDVVDLLVAAVTQTGTIGGIYEAGGPDVVTYAQMMALYAETAGLARRRLIRVPFLTPRLSSLWVGLVTPVPVPLARELVESLVNEVIVGSRSAVAAFSVRPMGLRESISRALEATRGDIAATSFDDAGPDAFRPTPTDPAWSGGTVLTDVRSGQTAAGPDVVFGYLAQIGGRKGWYSGKTLWRLRGLFDQLLGGPGLRRGRRSTLAVGDPLDFWRVEDLVPGRRLRLHAEMRLPGDAWLTWDLEPVGPGTTVTQTALFRPRGLLGRIYWVVVAPFHRFVFPGILGGLLAEADALARLPTRRGPPASAAKPAA